MFPSISGLLSFTLILIESISIGYYGYDRLYAVFTTRSYNYDEFDAPGASLTGNYWDFGEDTDNDGKFNQLIIEVEINVIDAGDYYVYLSLGSPEGAYLSGSGSGYFSVGIHRVKIYIDTYWLYTYGVDTFYYPTYVYLRDSSYNTIESISCPAYVTRTYDHTSFDPPETSTTTTTKTTTKTTTTTTTTRRTPGWSALILMFPLIILLFIRKKKKFN
jgi:hypothetical protein